MGDRLEVNFRIVSAAELLAAGRDEDDAYDIRALSLDSEVVARFGQWAVTRDGLECLDFQYSIESERIHADNWLVHMAEKDWVRMLDFIRAFQFAESIFPRRDRARVRSPLPGGRAATIVRLAERDGFHCRHCRATKGLQVDHVVPVAKGGSGFDHNLQLLCRRCNARKRDRDPSTGELLAVGDRAGAARRGWC